MKKWESATIIELGLEKTETNSCPVNPAARTAWPETFECLFGKYEPVGILRICKHFNCNAPGNCDLNLVSES